MGLRWTTLILVVFPMVPLLMSGASRNVPALSASFWADSMKSCHLMCSLLTVELIVF
jgi:hypothetical protein